MSGVRLVVGIILMGILLPVALFFLLGLNRPSQLFTLSVSIFLSWGLGDMLATLLERPRLENRSPGKALEEELERRRHE